MAFGWAMVASLQLSVLSLDGAAGSWLLAVCRWGIFINVLLAIFNMVPIPPLDGGREPVAVEPGPDQRGRSVGERVAAQEAEAELTPPRKPGEDPQRQGDGVGAHFSSFLRRPRSATAGSSRASPRFGPGARRIGADEPPQHVTIVGARGADEIEQQVETDRQVQAHFEHVLRIAVR